MMRLVKIILLVVVAVAATDACSINQFDERPIDISCTDDLVADIYFLADSSNSIYPTGWAKELNFVANVSQAFPLGPKNVQVAFGIFSSDFRHTFDLNRFTSQHDLAKEVLSTAQLHQNTYTYDALIGINQNGYLTSPAHGGGRNVPKILLVITDGQSKNLTKTIIAADDLRKTNVTILSVGVGYLNPIELQGIAGDPRNVFNVRSFSVLDTIRPAITQRICDVPQPPVVDPCRQNILLDLVFVIDTANKAGSDNVQRNLVFITAIIRSLNLGENTAKVGLVISGSEPVVVHSLTASLDIIYQSLAAVTIKEGNTNSYQGLLAASKLFTSANGAREDSVRTIIVITDGVPQGTTSTLREAEEVKHQGINVITVGILPDVDGKVSTLASRPEYSFTVKDYTHLISAACPVAGLLCSEPTTTTSTTTTTTTAKPTTPAGNCTDRVAADIYFLADSSNSIYPTGWAKELHFIANVSQAFPLGPNNVQVAFGIFSSEYRHIFDLNKHTNQAELAKEVLATAQLHQNTHTFDALIGINSNGYLTSATHGADRNVPRILFVITDGQSQNIAKTIAAAEEIRKQGVIIFSIGVGVLKPEELEGIAGDKKNVFNVRSFAVLDTIRQEITQRICIVAPPTPEPTTAITTEATTGGICDERYAADIYFLADSSNSIYPTGWAKELHFVANVSQALPLGPSSVQIGFGIFSSDFRHIFDLNRYTSQKDLSQEILSTAQLHQNTYTYDALIAINRNGYLTSPAHGGGRHVPKLLLLITDGQSKNTTKTVEAAEELRKQGVTILSIGVGVLNKEELEGIAGDKNNVYNVRSFAVLDTIRQEITHRICNEPPTTTSEPTTSTTTTTTTTTTTESTTEITPSTLTTDHPCYMYPCGDECITDYWYDSYFPKANRPRCIEDPCDDSPCEQICNIDYSQWTYECSCDDGFVQDPEDPTKCQVPTTTTESTPTTTTTTTTTSTTTTLETSTAEPTTTRDPCEWLQCEQVCFPSTNWAPAHCACGEGFVIDEDDPSKCKGLCDFHPCEQICSVNDDFFTFTCSCHEGYEVDPTDPSKCKDKNECASKPCQQTCTNTPGSYVCSCRDGYYLSSLVPGLCQEPTCVDTLAADIYFLGDSSNSINSIGWGRELTFIVNVSQAFDLSRSEVQIAFGIFSSAFKHIFNLDKHTSHSALAQEVLGTAQLKQNTYTYDALNAINQNGYLTSAEYSGDRKVPDILIVITDGQSQNVAKTINAADELRKKNITVLSVGVGYINPVELEGIAGDAKNVFSVKSFGVIDTIRGEITQRICEVPTPLLVTPCSRDGLLDLVFVIDSSSKFGTDNFDRNLVFVSSIIRAFSVSERATKVGLIVSDQTPYTGFSLTSSMDVVYQSLVKVPYKNSTFHTYQGLLEASRQFSPTYGSRPDATRTIILITDGKSQDGSFTTEEAKSVKSRGINVITVAVHPEADEAELAEIASKPQYSVVVQNYISLYSSAGEVADLVCQGSR